jgi:RHS repeat-associated protein
MVFKQDKTISQLLSHFKVYPTMIAKRKSQLIERVDEIFLNDHTKYRQYDESGNLVKTIDPLGNETNYRYDNFGRKISETNAEGGVTKFAYWRDGQMQSLTDPVGNKTIWVYNLLGRVSREIITLDKKVVARFFYYDVNGNIVTKIDRNNRVTSWTYDKLNRATSEIWHSSWRSFIDNKQPIKKFTTTYNNKGKIESTEDGDNNFTFAYGIFGNEIKQNQNLSDLGKPIEFNFVTNINGQKTEKILNVDGKIDHKNKYEFDNLNRTTNISHTVNQNIKSVKIQYDNLGQLVNQTRFDSDKSIIVTKNKFDQAGRLINISHSGGGKTYADYDLTWDNANRITDFDFTYLNGPAKKNGANYRYDKTSQLIAANYNYNFMQNEMYDFDLNGNRKKAKIQDKNESYKTGEYNRLLSDENYRYEYDQEGNRISKTNKDNTTTKYFWDHRNRLIKVQTSTESVEYIYDYQNRLVKRSQNKAETHFVHDGWQIILQFENKEIKPPHRYLWGTKQDELICTNNNWTLTDHLSTIRDIVKSDGTVVSHLEYNAFGKLISETKNDLPFFAYTGKLFDNISNLQWNINRWYDSSVGRWANDDPIGFIGGDKNLYRYSGNIVFIVDKMGLANSPDFNTLGCSVTPCEAKCRTDYPVDRGGIFGLIDKNAIQREGCIKGCGYALNGYDLTVLDPSTLPFRIKSFPQGFATWYGNNKNLDWTNSLPDCPCKLVKNGEQWEIPVNVTHKDWGNPVSGKGLCGYHVGAAFCIRSKHKETVHTPVGDLVIPTAFVSANQCCYTNDGKLITKGSGMGSADYYQGTLVTIGGHLLFDMKPADAALKLDGGVWGPCSEAYLLVRPQKGTTHCDPNPTPL